MSRAYRNVRVQLHRVYNVAEVMELYQVSRNTVSNWLKQGLRPSDRQQPQLFRGAELRRFDKERRSRTIEKLRPGEFRCFRCKAAVLPKPGSIAITPRKKGGNLAEASCSACDATVMKFLGETECDMVRSGAAPNASAACTDEGIAPSPARIGKDRQPAEDGWHCVNDRIIHDWQLFAGRYDKKTVEAKLQAIREFESFSAGKPFGKIVATDAAHYRDHLIARVIGGALPALSRSTVLHRASHLRAFFDWLKDQRGYGKVAGVKGYFALPRKMNAVNHERQRAYPSIDEAVAMLETFPAASMKDRRGRALFALAFVSGFRASALVTVRVEHVDVERQQVNHDGHVLRAKNGKSYVANWFPRTDAFREVLIGWLDEVQTLGLRPGDALFPEVVKLQDTTALAEPDRPPVEPMSTVLAVREAFRKASSGRFGPHSCRHTLAQLGDLMCRTSEQRKAWSLNLGHASEEVTWRHYGRVTDERKTELFEEFDASVLSTSEEIDLMLDYHEHRLVPGTPEFRHAEDLVEKRRIRAKESA